MMTPHFEPPSGGMQWDDLARYFAGEMSEYDASAMRRWIAADPDRAAQVERLRAGWDAAGLLRGSWNTEAALARMLPPAATGPARVTRLPRHAATAPGAVVPSWRRLGRWAAAAVVLVAGGLGLWRRAIVDNIPATSVAAEPTELMTPRGQRASLRLPDGTNVMLGPESKIRYLVDGTRGPRTVHLDGEAYFVVTHDDARPFTVHTARAVATDLGTRFGVRAYAEDAAVTVAVAEGAVSLRSATDRVRRDSVLLAPGDLGRVLSSGAVMAESAASLDRYLGWTTGHLVFRDTPLRDAVAQLGRWYDVDVQLGDSALGAKRVTAKFRKEPAARALALIAASLDLRVDARDSALVLRAR